MKQKLAQIYRDLSDGKLTKEQALEKIKAVKLPEQDKADGLILATPVWRPRISSTIISATAVHTEHHIFLCDVVDVAIKQIENKFPKSFCTLLKTSPHQNVAERYLEMSTLCFEQIKAILNSKPQGKILVQIVFSNNQEERLYIGLSGLLKSAALENPQFLGQIILTEPDSAIDELQVQLTNAQSSPHDNIIKFEQGIGHALCLEETHELESSRRITFKDKGVYLITGGMGGLGLKFANEIAKQTTGASIILSGRSELTSDRIEMLQVLSSRGSHVVYHQVDMEDLHQVIKLIKSIEEKYTQLNGIIHCAGVISDNFIIKKTSGEFRSVLNPKVIGTFNLDEASQNIDLDFMVLFSSTASWFGNLGQSDYASANGFMDQFAIYRNRLVNDKKRPGKTVSINWPYWEKGGMSINAQGREMLFQNLGMQPMETANGMLAFYRSLGGKQGQSVVMNGDPSRIREILFADRSDYKNKPKDHAMPVQTEQTPVSEIDFKALLGKTQDFLKKQLSIVLNLPASRIDVHAPLETYGIDSIMAMNLTNQLEKTFGSLSKTLFFEYQALDELSEYFIRNYSIKLAELFPVALTSTSQQKSEDREPASIEPENNVKQIPGARFKRQSQSLKKEHTSSENKPGDEAIAIIGLSGRYPGAVDVEEYWRNLREGKDCITEVPGSRWDWREYYSEDRTKPGHHYSKWGGFISGVDEFDPRFFNISPREAEAIDPQERLFLLHSWMAIEDAGYNRAALQIPQEGDLAGQVGVYAGVMYGEYNLSGSLASIANRVSYVLNLHGPSLTVDTMCSSSLSAIHLACQDLKCGRISLAIAGGVNVSISPNKYSVLSEGQFISSGGHCQSFGEGGDGYIPGEGVGVVVLKRLSEARRDKNHIYGIIRGTALNHGGKTNGYTVPNPQAQASVISRVLSESETDPHHISYLEAHGTGTKLGDPIEIAALARAFQQHANKRGFCLIGSAKSNIGHCESAAGMAGLTKVLLQMKYQQIAPSLHSERLNPNIDFAKTPFIVNQKLRTWEQPIIEGKKIPRIAGISSFGAGGSNAHIIVQEYLSSHEENISDKHILQNANVMIPLSARTADQLKQKAKDLYDFIGRSRNEGQLLSGKAIDLFALAYTLQVGREPMEERVGFLVNSIPQLEEKLRAYITGEQDVEDCFPGQVKANRDSVSLFSSDPDLDETLRKWISERKLSKLLEWWAKGLQFDWNNLYEDAKPARISIPTYPFAKERYWLDAAARGHRMIEGKATSLLHPLLHVNRSQFGQQRFSSTFTGNEFFIKDYRIKPDGSGGQRVLPIVASLEMVRAAIGQALPHQEEANNLKLDNVSWGQPIVIEENKEYNIVLFENDNEQIEYEIYSQDREGEIVYCQGIASVGKKQVTTRHDLEDLRAQMQRGKLDSTGLYDIAFAGIGLYYGSAYRGITALYHGDHQLLAELKMPGAAENSSKDFILHPGIMDCALQASISLIADRTKYFNGIILPSSIDSINILSPCSKGMFAWVRRSQEDSTDDGMYKCDIDLCDQDGSLAIQMLGVTYHLETAHAAGQAAEEGVIEKTSSTPARIPIVTKSSERVPLTGSQVQDFSKSELKKPSISLISSETNLFTKSKNQSLNKSSITLADSSFESSPQGFDSEESAALTLYDNGDGIFEIRISDGGTNTLSDKLITQLIEGIEKVRHEVSSKVLIISGTERYFLTGNRKHHARAIEHRLYSAIATFPYPVIACMQGDTAGVGFLVSALCDFMVCSHDGHYRYTNPAQDLYPTEGEEALFAERFGEIQSLDFLYQALSCPNGYTGAQLKTKGWTCPVLPSEQVRTHALHLASDLAKKNQESLRLLKQHLARRITPLVNGLDFISTVSYGQPGEVKQNKKAVTSTNRFQAETYGESILLLRMVGYEEVIEVTSLISDLSIIIQQVRETGKYKVVVLTSECPDFLPESFSTEDVITLGNLILDCPIPVVAVLGPKAQGRAWFFGHHCDAAVYHADGRYSAGNILRTSELAGRATIMFTHRLGLSIGQEVLLTGRVYTGADLQGRLATLLVGTQDLAMKIAESWTSLPEEVLIAWKKRRSSGIHLKVDNLPPVQELEETTVTSRSEVPVQVSLKSRAVIATAHPQGILDVRMEDRVAKNMFSQDLANGINEIFAHIEGSSNYKAVVLTGYDTYFASGGTKESLLAIQEGKVKFTDNKIYQLAMECKVPVIAAMQGHGLGAGWSMGMFADLVLFSEESKYRSPYMSYGFTPGAGATMIFPRTIGNDLARETMLTGQEYSGSELKSRGLQQLVLPRAQVYSAAMGIASDIARYPLYALMNFKRLVTQHLSGQVEEAYSLELSMHDKTFVGKADTLSQIKRNFTSDNNPHREETRSLKVQADNPGAHTYSDANLFARVNTTIKKLLAHELHVHENEIDGDTQFVDLGLDSITGVTWIRKINEKYKTSIDATKVYSYTTLNQMSRYVRQEAERSGSLDEKEVLVIPKTVSTPASDFNGLSEVGIHVKRLLAMELHMPDHEIDEDAQFVDLGLDSITGVTWIRKINEEYKTSIDATKIYSYSTLKQMSSYVESEARKQGVLKEKSEAKEAEISAPDSMGSLKMKGVQIPKKEFISLRNKRSTRPSLKTHSSYHSQPIAVIGMAGQFPQANNIEEFWQNIANGKNCIGEIPKKRWDVNTFYQDGNPVAGKTNSRFQGSLEGYDLFDPLFFTISPLEAESMDPQQRLFLQTCWHSIENAGYNPKDLSGSRCGVFVGCGTNDYQLLSRELQISAQGFTGVSPSILAARISYFLNLQGPCLSIETACSSSLVAIANACDSLVIGSSDIALAGGVNIMAGPDMHIRCSQSGMLSLDGKCYTFDQRANGFVPGEGVGVVMLKRLADAERDQDTIYGVIQGWGVNQDGKTNGITAPNSESQTRLEQEVYDKFGIDPNQIQLVEAHGTGTKLGDPIEVDALKQSFKKYTEKKEYCALGSVKSNIGHCLTAAGIAGFIKVLMSIEHKKLPPTINYENLNEHINLKDSPFYVNTQLKEWVTSDTRKRQAAVSAFGFSGTNAHIVVSEYIKPAPINVPSATNHQPGEVIIPLSARTTEQLNQKALDFISYIQKFGQSVNLKDVAYTLQVGREAMEVRLALTVQSVKDLEEKLHDFVEGKERDGIYRGQVKRSNETLSLFMNDDDLLNAVGAWINKGKFDKFLDLWVKGLPFNWQSLYNGKKLQRLRLPVYPFAKEHCWIGVKDAGQSLPASASSTILHPLLHTNTSDLGCQKYSSTFSGEEFFFKDHHVNGNRLLPGVSYLEMARTAITLSSPGQSSNILELYHTTWLKPFAVDSQKEVSVALYEEGDSNRIAYEIYGFEKGAGDATQEILYCKGQAEFRPKVTLAKLNIEHLKGQMTKGRLEAGHIYETLTKMGFNYGPAHQGIRSMLLGENEVLAELRLPSVLVSSDVHRQKEDYVLHPSLMDSALQATVGLISDLNHHLSGRPSVPFLLDTLRILSPCTREMFAWVRYSNSKTSGPNISKVDIDMCDAEGNICVQMEGFTSRVMGGEINPGDQEALNSPGDSDHNLNGYNASFDEAHYRKLISDFLNNEVSIDEALDLV